MCVMDFAASPAPPAPPLTLAVAARAWRQADLAPAEHPSATRLGRPIGWR
jgi:hypothetical protein